jgi:DNA-binding transcriptional ArsR family regulator
MDDDRLRRLIEAEGGEESDDAVDARLAELDDLDTGVSDGMDAELATVKAVANPTRYRIVKLLAAGGERTVGELDAVVGVSQSAISHALSDLADAGLVERRRDGTWRYYDTTDAAERLVAVLGELQE